MVDGLSADDSGAVFGTVERLAEAGHDPRRFASDLLDRLRDLVLLRSVPDAAARGLVSAPDDELTRMSAQAERIGLATLSRYAEIIHNGLLEMRGATAPRLLLELLCARMLLPSASEGEAAVLQRLERLERRLTAGGAVPAVQPVGATDSQPSKVFQRASQHPEQKHPELKPAIPSEPHAAPSQAPAHPAVAEAQPAPAPQPADPAPGAGLDATAIRGIWPQLLAAIRRSSRSTEAMLTNATVHSVDGSTVVLSHTAEPLARRLSETRNAEVIAAGLGDVLGGEWQVRCVHAGSAGAAQTVRPAPRAAVPAAPREQPQRSFRRPSARSEQRNDPPRSRPAEPPQRPATTSPTSAPDIPLPPEPDDEDMYTEEPASLGQSSGTATDRGQDVHKLLSDHLGARPLE
ncbi:MAG: DNA polymerase III subunit gamma/tau, partial [Pseudonocardiaceae bacterium]